MVASILYCSAWKARGAGEATDGREELQIVHFSGLSQHFRLVTCFVVDKVEGTGLHAAETRREIGMGCSGKRFVEQAQRVGGIAREHSGLPQIGEGLVGLRGDMGGLQLVEKFVGSVHTEAHVGAGKVLVKHRSVQEIGILLLFDRVAGGGENMSAAGENSAGD